MERPIVHLNELHAHLHEQITDQRGLHLVGVVHHHTLTLMHQERAEVVNVLEVALLDVVRAVQYTEVERMHLIIELGLDLPLVATHQGERTDLGRQSDHDSDRDRLLTITRGQGHLCLSKEAVNLHQLNNADQGKDSSLRGSNLQHVVAEDTRLREAMLQNSPGRIITVQEKEVVAP